MTPHPLIARLRNERKHRSMSQHDIAKRTGWSRRTVAAAEIGAVNPTLNFVDDYAAALGICLQLVYRVSAVAVEVPERLASRRVCPGCSGVYQVTRLGVIRKHGCTVEEEK